MAARKPRKPEAPAPKITLIVHDMPQRSLEWYLARLGKVTGSEAKNVMSFNANGKESAGRRDYRTQLVCERLTGSYDDDRFVNKEMQRGIELEPAARAAYEAKTGHVVESIGFVEREGMAVGASVDGHVNGFEGIVEIKCPKTATHVRYLRGAESEGVFAAIDGPHVLIPSEHFAQVLHNLWVTGAKWADFVSYDDRLGKGLDLFVARMYADHVRKEMAEYVARLEKFLGEVNDEQQALERLRGEAK